MIVRSPTHSYQDVSWWRQQMETFSALLAFWVGNSSVTGEFRSHIGQWRGALMFSLICAWTNGRVNNRDTITLIMTSPIWFLLPLLTGCPIISDVTGRSQSWSQTSSERRTEPQHQAWKGMIYLQNKTVLSTHWIVSDNGLSPGRHHVIIWTSAGILLIRTLVTIFSEI